MKKILLCCSAGMSSSILVKNMRQTAAKLQIECAIASISSIQVEQYIEKADIVLLAPQCVHGYSRIEKIAKPLDVPILLIGRKEYGEMDGESVLIRALKRIELKQEEEMKMDRVSAFIEAKIMPYAIKFGSNRTLTIIRNAMCSSMALLIIGSIAILLPELPYEPLQNFFAPAAPFLYAINACTTGILALFIAGSMGYYGAEAYSSNKLTNTVTSIGAFVLTQYNVETGIDVSGFGTSGLLTAIVVGLVTVKIISLFETKGWGIKMPEGVPPAVSDSFSSLIPAAIIVIIFGVIAVVLEFNLNTFMATIMSPVSNLLKTWWGYAIYHSLMGLVFFCGINSAVVCDVAYPFLLANGIVNEEAIRAGGSAIYGATYCTDVMIWAGGTGATIGLMILMTFFAKSQYFKTLGKMSIGPGIFNINEPIIFGTPICFNPIFLLPFVLLPGILAGATVLMMETGIIAMPTVSIIPWTTPPIIVAFLMTGGALSTTIWGILICVISIVVYYPFFRVADKQQYEKEKHEELQNEIAGEVL